MIVRKKRSISAISRKRLFEMAFDKEKYQYFVSAHIPQIAQNWCLMMFCKLYRNDLANTYEHWRSELEEQLNEISIKPLNKKDKRHSYTHQVLFDFEELSNPEQVYRACRVKFKHENEKGLGITKEQQLHVCKLFSESLDDIVNCICNDIFEYTDSLFPPLR